MEEVECGICLDTKRSRGKGWIVCPLCSKRVHVVCWNVWIQRSGRCVYCGFAVVDRSDAIMDSDDDPPTIDEFESESSDDESTAVFTNDSESCSSVESFETK